MKKPKTAEVEYIDSGAYQGCEEDAYLAKFSRTKDKLVVIRDSDFHKLWKLAKAEIHTQQATQLP